MDVPNKYQTLLTRMLSLTLITSDEYNFLKDQENKFEDELEPFPQYPVLIPSILSKVSKAIIRDAECGRIPPDYEHMVLDLFRLIEKDTGTPTVELDYQKEEEGNDLYRLVIRFENTEFEKE